MKASAQGHGQGKGDGKAKGDGRKSEGKGKGDSKGKGKLPTQIRVSGASGLDPDGNPICFAFNIGGCAAAPPGGRCPRGRHICILVKCGQAAHGYGTTHKEFQ